MPQPAYERRRSGGRQLLETVDGLKARGFHLVNLEKSLDMSAATGGEFLFDVFGTIVHFERRLISERARAMGRRSEKARQEIGPPALQPGNTSELSGQRLNSVSTGNQSC